MKRIINILLLCLGCMILLSCKDKRYFTVTRIRDAAKLATTETVIEKIIVGNKKKRILRIFTLDQARFVCYSEARIKAGIDLKKLNREDVKIDGKQIDVILPAVEVINFSYPFSRFRIDSTLLDNGLFARISISDMEEFYRMAELDIRAQLPYMGITESTENKTRQMMESLLRSLGYVEIYIHFRKGPLITQVKLTEQQ